MSLREYLKNIADTLRNWLNSDELINAQNFPEAINSACETQYANGSNDGYVYGYDEGYWVGEEVGYSDGYNEGHEEGYIEGYHKGGLDYSPQETVSGEAIGITDISPIEHTMAVSVKSKNIVQYTIYSGGKELVAGASYSETNFKLTNKLPANTPLYFAIYTEDGVMVTTSGVSRTLRQKNYQVTGELQKDISSNTKAYTLTEDEANVASYVYVYMVGTVVNTYAGKTVNKLVISTEPIDSYAPYIEDISTVKLLKQGKNLLSPYTLYEGLNDYKEGIDTTTGRKYIRFIDDKQKRFNWKFKANTQYTVSAWVKTTIKENANNQNSHILHFWYTDGTTSLVSVPRNTDWVFISTTSSAGKTIKSIGMYTYNYVNYVYVDVDTFMLEEGTTATEYEPYIEPTVYDVKADGTVEGVKSLYPSTTLYTDTSGAVIDCTYYQDGKKVKENLTDMILELGGVINE